MSKIKLKLSYILLIVIVIYILCSVGKDLIGASEPTNTMSRPRSRRDLYPSTKKRPCPDGGTCCSLTFYDSHYGNQSFYLKCGDIPEAYPPCRRVHYSEMGFPGCCPILACPPYFTYIDAFIYTRGGQTFTNGDLYQ